MSAAGIIAQLACPPVSRASSERVPSPVANLQFACRRTDFSLQSACHDFPVAGVFVLVPNPEPPGAKKTFPSGLMNARALDVLRAHVLAALQAFFS